MKLQAKVITILTCVWVFISLIIYADSKFILAKNYEKLERTLIVDNIHDVQNIFDRMLSTLALYTLAWAQWDAAYDFMKNKDPEFIKSNFVPGTFTSSQINFFIFYDPAGKFYYGKAYDFDTNQMSEVPDSLLKYLSVKNDFVKHDSTTSKKIGILTIPEGLIVMTSLPVITGDGKGPVRGGLLMGYYLKNSHVQAISDTVDMKINFYPLPLPTEDKLLNEAYQHLKNGEKNYSIPRDATMAYGFILLKDLDDQPVGVLEIEIPRTVYLEGLITVHHYLQIVIILGIMILILMWYLLKFFVLNRVLSVSKQVVTLSSENRFDKKIKLSGSDELASMVLSINNMMQIISISQKQLHHMANHDGLTALINRHFFYELLDKALEESKLTKTKVAVMFLDMDKFKQINDSYGHDVGDKLLKLIAQRLKHATREGDVIARQSGDEFILFLTNVESADNITMAAERILAATSRPFKIDNIEINAAFSIGISVYPNDGMSIEELLKRADKAMYVAKQTQGSAFHFYDSDIEAKQH